MSNTIKPDLRDLTGIFDYADRFPGYWFTGCVETGTGCVEFDGTIQSQDANLNRVVIVDRINPEDERAAGRVCLVVNFIHQLLK